jgi:hypothetical protein
MFQYFVLIYTSAARGLIRKGDCYKYTCPSLYALSLSAFSHIRGFISASWAASISCKLPRRPTELRAQVYWLTSPFWLRELQIKAFHGVSLRKSMGMLYVSRFMRFRYTRWLAGTQPPRITRVACNWILHSAIVFKSPINLFFVKKELSIYL